MPRVAANGMVRPCPMSETPKAASPCPLYFDQAAVRAAEFFLDPR